LLTITRRVGAPGPAERPAEVTGGLDAHDRDIGKGATRPAWPV